MYIIKNAVIIALILCVMMGIVGAKPINCSTFADCGGFCSGPFYDCDIGCKCVGADSGNQGICRK